MVGCSLGVSVLLLVIFRKSQVHFIGGPASHGIYNVLYHNNGHSRFVYSDRIVLSVPSSGEVDIFDSPSWCFLLPVIKLRHAGFLVYCIMLKGRDRIDKRFTLILEVQISFAVAELSLEYAS